MSETAATLVQVEQAVEEEKARLQRQMGVGFPFKCLAIPPDERYVYVELVPNGGALFFQTEVAIPGHSIQGQVVERGGVVKEPGVSRIFFGRESAARHMAAFTRGGVFPIGQA